MEKAEERLFKNFERPPFAPTYFPTEEEFRDPIAFIAKIKGDAEKFGIVKIKPPPSFQPPFAIDLDKFSFTPRLQKLNELEAVSRVKINFINKLANFWHLQGIDFKLPVIDGKFVDVYKLHKVVESYAGYERVVEEKKWSFVAKKLGLKTHHGSVLKAHYLKWLCPFDQLHDARIAKTDEEMSESEEKKSPRACRVESEETKPRSRMMAGVTRAARPAVVTRARKSSDPLSNLVCLKCSRGDQEELLLLCETCDGCLHTFCVTPALSAVPRGEWRCSQCVAVAVATLDQQFGFEQSQRRYTLKQFGLDADAFKRAYFAPDTKVSLDRVESEFWRNVIDLSSPVSVKYGADLFTTDVGSGFPRKDSASSPDRLVDLYAHHQWNLNNLPVLKNSVLSHINVDISGMMVPWVYVGMCFSTFCWHTEDHWSYSINYLHWGETKVWYGIPGADGDRFEQTMQDLVPDLFRVQPDLLHHIVTMLNPRLLMNRGIPVHTVHQHAGEFVVTFPRAYHAGFNEGFNFAEAVNFAPSDWLSMGRDSVENYSLSRRQCVFSHDELVCGMATRACELDVGMAIACLEDVSRMARIEAELRERLRQEGLHKAERTVFEVLGDDQRQCAFCKTTLFLSAVACSCPGSRLVCLRHATRVCTTCPLSKCTLKYRYMMDEMPPLMNCLRERVKTFHVWRARVETLVTGGEVPKPDVDELRGLLENARVQRLPHCAALEQLVAVLQLADKHSTVANRIISNKMRTRKSQLAVSGFAKKLHLSELEAFMTQLDDLPCVIPQAAALREFMDKVLQVQLNGERALAKARNNRQGDFNDISTMLRDALENALQLDLQLSLIPALKQELDQCQWMLRVDRLLRVHADDSDDSDEEDEQDMRRSGFDRLKAAINEGNRLDTSVDGITERLRRLQGLLQNARANDLRASQFLANDSQSLDSAETIMNDLLDAGSSDSPSVLALRRMVDRGRDWLCRYRLLYEERQCFHLRQLTQLQSTAKGVPVSRAECERIEQDQRRLKDFVARIETLFQKSAPYYTIAEIIAPRDDLCQLVEGQRLLLSPHSPRSGSDWHLLDEWTSISDLNAHLDHLAAQQCTLMRALRRENNAIANGAGCVCANAKPEADLVVCRLCCNRYHEACVQWDSGLDQMPGVGFLCVRCLRGRRPCIEDVLAACHAVPEQSLELALVRHLLARARRLHREARMMIAELGPAFADRDSPAMIEARSRIDDLLLQMLGLEVSDSDLWPILYALLARLDPISDLERACHDRLRSRPVPADASHTVLFASPADMRRVKRTSLNTGCVTSSSGTRKRARAGRGATVFHEDSEQCAAPSCLRPVGDSVHWVQCETGCDRWFHLVCVGLTVNGTRHLDAYACFQCRPVFV